MFRKKLRDFFDKNMLHFIDFERFPFDRMIHPIRKRSCKADGLKPAFALNEARSRAGRRGRFALSARRDLLYEQPIERPRRRIRDNEDGMPWSSDGKSGGGGKNGGSWKPGGPGPWGQGPIPQRPDLEEWLRQGQDKLKQWLPGGGIGGRGLLALALIGILPLALVGILHRRPE